MLAAVSAAASAAEASAIGIGASMAWPTMTGNACRKTQQPSSTATVDGRGRLTNQSIALKSQRVLLLTTKKMLFDVSTKRRELKNAKNFHGESQDKGFGESSRNETETGNE